MNYKRKLCLLFIIVIIREHKVGAQRSSQHRESLNKTAANFRYECRFPTIASNSQYASALFPFSISVYEIL